MNDTSLEACLGAEAPALGCWVAFFIPNRDRVGTPVPGIDRWVTQAEDLCVRMGRGATKLTTQGASAGANGMTVQEETQIVAAFVHDHELSKNLNQIRHFLHRFGRETDQEFVALLMHDGVHTKLLQISKYDN